MKRFLMPSDWAEMGMNGWEPLEEKLEFMVDKLMSIYGYHTRRS